MKITSETESPLRGTAQWKQVWRFSWGAIELYLLLLQVRMMVLCREWRWRANTEEKQGWSKRERAKAARKHSI